LLQELSKHFIDILPQADQVDFHCPICLVDTIDHPISRDSQGSKTRKLKGKRMPPERVGRQIADFLSDGLLD